MEEPFPPWLAHAGLEGRLRRRQLAAIADEDRYRPQARLLARLLGHTGPRAGLAHLCPQPVLAQGSKLDEGEREGQAGENRADGSHDVSPARRTGHNDRHEPDAYWRCPTSAAKPGHPLAGAFCITDTPTASAS
jgi:hypothetical protein